MRLLHPVLHLHCPIVPHLTDEMTIEELKGEGGREGGEVGRYEPAIQMRQHLHIRCGVLLPCPLISPHTEPPSDTTLSTSEAWRGVPGACCPLAMRAASRAMRVIDSRAPLEPSGGVFHSVGRVLP